MKKQTLIFVITINYLLITINLFSQPCLPEGIVFSDQTQINNFQVNYTGCTEIEGSVTINSQNAPPPGIITNLNGLNVITSIGGDLGIYHNDYLPNLGGLENLTSIGGDLSIRFNQTLTSLNELTSLTFIGGNLNISNNYQLTDCDAQWLCNYLTDPNGVITINNATGCGNVIQVGYSCGGSLPCLPYGNYVFNHQYDINNFQQVFPGCTDLS